MKSLCRFIAFVIAALALVPEAGAIASVSQVAYAGRPVESRPGWPEGTVALINDPVRTTGWNPWFSELPNDVNYYGFEPQNMDDVNRLIQKLSDIKGTKVHLRLNPSPEASPFGYVSTRWNPRTAAVLTLGNQEVLNRWFSRNPEIRPGVRKFGVSELSKPPVAMPPTLTLYVGQLLFDLDRLKVPPGVMVEPDVTPAQRKEQPDSATIKAIDHFVSRSKSR